jgi:alpha-L-fucosidase 2
MKRVFTAVLLTIAIGSACSAFAGDLTLWYQSPAGDKKPINEALPIGNGRIGALICGNSQRERLIVNEDSLWTGDENPSGNYDSMGEFQFLGNIFINLPGHANPNSYRRELSIDSALANVNYEQNGVRFQRECFCSHPAGLLVARLTADKTGSYSGSIELDDSHKAKTIADGATLTASGQLSNGLKYEWQLRAQHSGGSLEADGATLVFKECDSLTLLVCAGTNYVMDYARHYRCEDPHDRVSSRIDSAAQTSYDNLKSEHERDYESLFNRVTLNLGRSSDAQSSLPTDKRKLEAFKTFDPELEALLFQYGRYLMISCSRPGGLPANLQGLWNDSNNPPWHSDYHVNINIQMNYWPAEVANLAECHVPLFDLIRSQLVPWRAATAVSPELKTTAGEMSTRGFAIRTSHNIFGGMGWKWDKTANAWYCQHLWEHFAFGRDKTYLRDVAYPILKETCQFWEDHLKALQDGRLVVPDGWSPEHGPVEDGVSYNQEIVWDLFNNFVEAAGALDCDQDYREHISNLRDRLVVPKVGSWGQLLEWMNEKQGENAVPNSPDLDTPNDHHRHTSHLFAVFPGRQISMAQTPDLAKGAIVSLAARGIADSSDVREWSFAWRAALYARLRDGDDAHRMLEQLFSQRNTCPNLFGLHPPMQIDGNFGATAGMAEMLLQSHSGEIELLPALPKAWQDGKVRGLRARGGFTVDISWKDGKLFESTIHSATEMKCKIRYGNRVIDMSIPQGESRRFDSELREGV